MEEGRARRGRPPGRIGQPPAGPRDKDLAFPGGPPLWHITPTILDENLQWAQNEVNTQLQLLKLTVESAQEPCLPAAENEHYCLYCLTNINAPEWLCLVVIYCAAKIVWRQQ